MHTWKLYAREPGDPGAARGCEKAAGRRKSPQGQSPHPRRREVGLPRTTCEGSEHVARRAEELEGRRRIKENARKEHTSRAQDREIASRGLQGVREAAQRDKGLRFTTLLHRVNEKRLLDSFYLLKKQAAPGLDRLTWSEYEEGVEARTTDLHDRIHRGGYRAQPSRRVYIRKPDGRQRPGYGLFRGPYLSADKPGTCFAGPYMAGTWRDRAFPVQTGKSTGAEVGRLNSGAVKPDDKHGPRFRAPLQWLQSERHSG